MGMGTGSAKSDGSQANECIDSRAWMIGNEMSGPMSRQNKLQRLATEF